MTRPLPVLLAFFTAAGLAAAQDSDHPMVRKVPQIQEAVSEMRGLDYLAPVNCGVKTGDELRAVMMEEFDKEASIEEMSNQEKVIKLFGLIPHDFALRERLIDFMSENVAGFYDPSKKELFIINSGQRAAMPQEDEMTMAHELHHALQDQNFDLRLWTELLSGDEDRSLAFSSVVEGDAMIVGLQHIGIPPQMFLQMQEMQGGMDPRAAEFPPYLLENMMFPYTQGAGFVNAVKTDRGWEGVDAMFRDPPTSTEMILHPEKYLAAERDEPFDLVLPEFLSVIGEDAEELYSNTMGEFNVSILLRSHGVDKRQAKRAAAGWDGDTFVGYEVDGRVVIVWLSTWDSEAEADEFARAYDACAPEGTAVQRRGTEVLMVAGANSATELAALQRRGFMALKMTIELTPLAAALEQPLVSDFSDAPAPTASAGPAAAEAAPATLYRNDTTGVSFLLPGGYAETEEPIDALTNYGSIHFERGNAHLRTLSWPIGFDAAIEQLDGMLSQGVEGFELLEKGTLTIAGRKAQRLVFKGTMPNQSDAEHTWAYMIDMGYDSLMIASSLPLDAPLAEGELVAGLIESSLWIDGASEPEAQRRFAVGNGRFVIEQPEGFVSRAGDGPIVCTLEGDGNAKVQVVRTDATNELSTAGSTLEAQLPLALDGLNMRAAGMVERRGRATHEIEFVVNGRRTRQITFDQNGSRWSVAVSAPADRFAELQGQFARALASARFQAGDAQAPQQPDRNEEQPRRRAY
ncbi:hypothetical protein OAX78_02415 [Planctomycetota bacterium]|nr:hypothetical protein [Planctomycetota bacterium]